MKKYVVNSNASIFEILKTYPELISLLTKLGFDELANPAIVKSLGRIKNLPTLAKEKGIDFDIIVQEFDKHDYDLGPK